MANKTKVVSQIRTKKERRSNSIVLTVVITTLTIVISVILFSILRLTPRVNCRGSQNHDCQHSQQRRVQRSWDHMTSLESTFTHLVWDSPKRVTLPTLATGRTKMQVPSLIQNGTRTYPPINIRLIHVHKYETRVSSELVRHGCMSLHSEFASK